MKKRNLFIGFCLALLTIISLGFSNPTPATAHADGASFTITFNASTEGTCETETSVTDSNGNLPSIPTATSNSANYAFLGWKLNNNFITTETVFTQNSTVNAVYGEKLNQYTITPNSDNTLTIKAKTFNNIDYETSCSTFTQAIGFISSDLSTIKNYLDLTLSSLTESSTTHYVELSQDIIISLPSTIETLTITGDLDLKSYQITFSQSHEVTLNFNNLNVSSSTNRNQFIIKETGRTTINLKNCSFKSDTNSNNYAIYFSGNNNVININDAHHTTKYLYNHKEGIISSITKASSELLITAPYTLDNQLIIETSSLSVEVSNIKFEATEDWYYCSSKYKASNIYLIASFYINFDANGGTFSSDSLANQSIRYRSELFNYPNSTQLTQTHKTLNGFIGKITLDESTKTSKGLSSTIWYFDQTKLSALLSDTDEIDIHKKIGTYFSDNIFETTNCFTYYKFDENDLQFKAVDLMFNLNQTPSFVAVWTETKYTITFHENGGENVSDLAETYGTKVTIPTPTRTGYTFDGWYSSEDLNPLSKVEPDSNGKYSITDQDVDFYAKWTAISYLLTIDNDGNSSSIDVGFDTIFSTISELQNLSKTGHSFAGWYTNANRESGLIDLETFTMPNNNLTIYAKWQINKYTINLYLKASDDEPYHSITEDFASDTSSLASCLPNKTGYEFKGWYTDTIGQNRYNQQFPYTPTTMPAEETGLNLYAFFIPIDYTITYYCNNSVYKTVAEMHYGDLITLPTTPNISGFVFSGWYLEDQTPFNIENMPAQNLAVYAKLQEKLTISLDKTIQTYKLSENGKFALNSNLNNFKVEYFVNNKWTIEVPTKKGKYDVKITRNEDSNYKSFSETIEGGLVITPNDCDLSAWILILYSVAGLELIIATILLFMTKQRKTYLSYAITLPFGIVSNSQFVNFSVSLVLAIFGFVLVIMQFVKLKNVNIEIEKISDERKEYKPRDFSEDSTISKKVEIILEQNGFASAKADNLDEKSDNFSDEMDKDEIDENTIKTNFDDDSHFDNN